MIVCLPLLRAVVHSVCLQVLFTVMIFCECFEFQELMGFCRWVQ
jgi:hypothetical protein